MGASSAARSGRQALHERPAGRWYEMDNWSNEPHPIKTQERWRRDIRKALEREVDEALVCAQTLLDAEGLIETKVA